MKNLLFSILIVSIFAISCEESTDLSPVGDGTISLKFDNRIGTEELVLNQTQSTNAMGETFTISTLNYFVSNIVLENDMGDKVALEDQYFLVREADPSSLNIDLTDIPAGNYTSISYMLGVDSLKSIADVADRKGVLDPASYGDDNMYWSWNMGYIFFKMEGNSDAVTNNEAQQFQFHIGGFGGKDAPTPNNLKMINLSFNQAATVSSNDSPSVHILFDAQQVFDATNKVELASTPMIHNPKVGGKIAANYENAFEVDHIHK